MADEPPIKAEGAAFFRSNDGGHPRELNNRHDWKSNADHFQWKVAPLTDGPKPEVIASPHREVRRFMRKVYQAMERTSPKPVRAVPKPIGKKPKAIPIPPPDAPVPCPRCFGQGLPSCDLCAGDGFVSPREAREFLDQHD